MAESKRVKAEEAEVKAPIIDGVEGIQSESPVEETAAKHEEEVLGAEEPLDIFSTADDKAFLTESGEFNWDAYESAAGYSSDEKVKYDKIYEETLSVIREREVIDATVVAITKREVVVNVGYKSEGVILSLIHI